MSSTDGQMQIDTNSTPNTVKITRLDASGNMTRIGRPQTQIVNIQGINVSERDICASKAQ